MNINRGIIKTWYIKHEIFKYYGGATAPPKIGIEPPLARGLVIQSFALFKKIFFSTLLHKLLEKFRISLFKKDILSVLEMKMRV